MNLDDALLSFPEAVTRAAALFQQGDLIEKPPIAYHTVGRYPLWSLSRNAPDDNALTLVELDEPVFDFGIITTQTCDITEEDSASPRKPWIQISPVCKLEDVQPMKQRAIEAFANSDLVRLTNSRFAEGFYVADLRISLPLEKSTLVGREPIPGFSTMIDRAAFADHCAAHHNRPALPALVHTRVVKHMRRYFEQRAKLREQCANAGMRMLRLKISGDDSHPIVQLVAVLTSADPAQRKQARDVLDRWWTAARKNAGDDPITLLGNQYLTLGELSAEEYLSSVPLRLDLIVS